MRLQTTKDERNAIIGAAYVEGEQWGSMDDKERIEYLMSEIVRMKKLAKRHEDDRKFLRHEIITWAEEFGVDLRDPPEGLHINDLFEKRFMRGLEEKMP
jgi:hypothetical protein